ncbi:hypothetical protein [Cribrihabitans neustonicus]|uniref:hypothetical protein n=1 Tax=Cribrihabitans neustonicus TaxID=1429085 RepID=UPI003B59E1F5
MSDPVTHAEIEDVLSSIRRLVSEDGRPPEAAPKPAGRLVLTPALRVHEGPEQSGHAGAAAADAAQVRAEAAGVSPVLDLLAGPDCLQLRSADVITDAKADAGPRMAAEAAPATSAGNGVPPVREDQAGPAGVPPAPEDHAGPAGAPDAEAFSSEAPWADPRATLFAAATSAPRINGASDTAGSRAASVLQKIAELEAKVAQSPGDWEPDGVPQDAFSGTAAGTISWQEEPEPEKEKEVEAADTGAHGEPADAEGRLGDGVAEAALTDAALESLPPEAAYHDEDSLRDLVSAIVREELQGALGERITRNIRKLVRREIHRVLATQDLL